jgi:hypothetical protein
MFDRLLGRDCGLVLFSFAAKSDRVTNVMGSTNQRNMAADCKGDMVRRQGAWSFGARRLAFGVGRSAFFGRYGLGSQRVLAKETSKGLKGF